MAATLILRPGEDDRLSRGHPWIFAEETSRLDGAAGDGEVVRLASSDGRDLGVGHYNPMSKIVYRHLSDRGPIDREFYLWRLWNALEKRARLFPGEDAYRLCFGESDRLPGLVIDRYGPQLAVQLLSAGMDRDWPLVQDALVELLRPEGILLRNDSELRKLEGLPLETRAAFGTVPERVEIQESGLRYVVPLDSGQKTGFYFDQRQNRLFTAPFCKGLRVLDVHCYLGGFALHAARAGAALALGLDTSAQAVALANENAALNGLAEKARFEQDDGEGFLRELAGAPGPSRPEVVFIDPPNFVRRKSDLDEARHVYARLFAKGLKCLARGGLLGASVCSRYVTKPAFQSILERAAKAARRRVETVSLRIQSDDHPVHPAMPETEYLHFGLVKVVGD